MVFYERAAHYRSSRYSQQRPRPSYSRCGHGASANEGMDEKANVMKKTKTNFDCYLEAQLEDPIFTARFHRAGEAWDVALQLAALRQKAGLSQTDLARKLKTSQQQISRLESPGYEGHSLSMLRRMASALNSHVRVIFEPDKDASYLAEEPTPNRIRRKSAKPI